ncbi:hypothetical protein [Agathobaculum sp.]|uniref:hypothetical protein n=1 Tax=Agathobaculum sp. TaxID=2048138 RepID=UPI00399FC55A
MEQITIMSSQDHINSLLGVPAHRESIQYPIYGSNDIMIGEKAIYVSKAFTIVVYYQDDSSLLGYVIIRQKEGFKPDVFGESSASWDKSIRENVGNDIPAESTVVGYLIGGRTDRSVYYTEAFSIHLATKYTYIGLGFAPQLGYSTDSDEEKLYDPTQAGFLLIQRSGIDSADIMEQIAGKLEGTEYRSIRPNAFYRFRYSLPCDGDIDTAAFLEEELTNKFFITCGESEDLHGIYYAFQ